MHQSYQNTGHQSATLPHPQQPELVTGPIYSKRIERIY